MPNIMLLGPGDVDLLQSTPPGVFDAPVKAELAREFLGDSRHHMAVAVEGDCIVGFVSAVHYLHPDKGPEIWINEIGVAPPHRGARLGKALLRAMFDRGREIGCHAAWVLTDRENGAARRLYESEGGIEPSPESVMYAFDLGTDAA